MCKVISVVNQKGGVGKTTTTVNVGIGLAREGKKVLLIDADPQGSLTASLGYEEPDDLRITLATIMMDVINEEEINLEDGILHHQENVDLLPANIELSALEVTMGNVMSREMIMKEYIDAIRSRYDYILIDCMPSLGMMTINALVSSDSVLIPVQAAYLPVKGLQQLIKTILTVKKRLNRKLAIEGILLTMVDFRTNYATSVCKETVVKQPFQIIKAANNGKTDADLLKGVGFSAWLVSDLKVKADGSYDFDSARPVVLTADGQAEMFTDEKGYARSIPLPYGTYVVKVINSLWKEICLNIWTVILYHIQFYVTIFLKMQFMS